MIFKKLLLNTLVLLALTTTFTTFAQSTPIAAPSPAAMSTLTRAISGIISLDKGVALKRYSVDIILTKRRLRITEAPFFSEIYVVDRTYRTTVSITEGESSSNYRIPGVTTFGAANKFAIEINCNECGPVVRNQYFTPSGNKFRYSNAVILEREEVPNRLSLDLDTGFSVSGTISLKGDVAAQRDLAIQVVASPINDKAFSFSTQVINFARGETSFNYQLGGIHPNLEGQFKLGLVCDNCDGIAPESTQLRTLFTLGQDNFDADFVLKNSSDISSIIGLLLDKWAMDIHAFKVDAPFE